MANKLFVSVWWPDGGEGWENAGFQFILHTLKTDALVQFTWLVEHSNKDKSAVIEAQQHNRNHWAWFSASRLVRWAATKGGATDAGELFVAVVFLKMSACEELWDAGTIFGETPQAKIWVSGNNYPGKKARLVDRRPYLALF